MFIPNIREDVNKKIYGLFDYNTGKYSYFKSQEELNLYIEENYLNYDDISEISIRYMGKCYGMEDSYLEFFGDKSPEIYTAISENQYAIFSHEKSTGKENYWIVENDPTQEVKKIYEKLSENGIIFQNDIYKLNKVKKLKNNQN